MSTDELLKRLRPIVDEWPVGTVVWHRASGHRGIIVEYAIDGAGCVMILVDYHKGHWEKEMPCCLSGTKVSGGTDGDEWKDGTGKGGGGMKKKIRIGWSCVSHHHHRWHWTAWLCCKIAQIKHLLGQWRGGKP